LRESNSDAQGMLDAKNGKVTDKNLADMQRNVREATHLKKNAQKCNLRTRKDRPICIVSEYDIFYVLKSMCLCIISPNIL